MSLTQLNQPKGVTNWLFSIFLCNQPNYRIGQDKESDEESDEIDESGENRSFGHDEMTASSLDGSDSDDGLSVESSTGVKLKLVFDVEYRAPE